MPNQYLYIPFTEDENNFQLQMIAMSWRMAAGEKGKKPKLIIHGENQFEEHIESNAVIYVLGHGHKNSQYVDKVVNTSEADDTDLTFLNMQTVADRLKADGVEAATNAKIKLFFCNEQGANYYLALAFINALGPGFGKSQTRIDFYHTIVSTPYKKNGQIYKHAKREVMSPYEGEASVMVELGHACQYRSRLSTNTELVSCSRASFFSQNDTQTLQDLSQAFNLLTA